MVPGFVGPFRVFLLALSAVEDEWQLHYAATGSADGGVSMEAEDDAGNSYDVRAGTYSRGNADPIVGRWNLIPPTGVEPAVLRRELGRRGFTDFAEIAAGRGSAVLARRADRA